MKNGACFWYDRSEILTRATDGTLFAVFFHLFHNREKFLSFPHVYTVNWFEYTRVPEQPRNVF